MLWRYGYDESKDTSFTKILKAGQAKNNILQTPEKYYLPSSRRRVNKNKGKSSRNYFGKSWFQQLFTGQVPILSPSDKTYSGPSR